MTAINTTDMRARTRMTDAEINDLLALPGGEIGLVTAGTSSGFDPSYIKAAYSGYTVADVRYSTTQRFKLAPLMAAAPKLQAALWQVRAENDRLRATLRRISNYGREVAYCRDGHEEAVLHARTALEGGADG